MNTSGNLTRLTVLDPEVVRADQEFFPRPWRSEDWIGLDFNHHLLYSWRTGEGLVGFALFQRIQGDETAHLLKILTKPSFRGTGTTQEFWKSIVESFAELKVQNVFLEVEAPNSAAIRFYEKAGFRVLRKVSGFYSDGTDALLMQLMLSETRV